MKLFSGKRIGSETVSLHFQVPVVFSTSFSVGSVGTPPRHFLILSSAIEACISHQLYKSLCA
jgi:hypothetical protein